MRERDKDFYDRLEAAGFQLDWGEDGSGLFMKYLRRGSGYYIDVGASDLVASGDIKLAGGQVARLTEDAVVLEDGTELPADLVVYATGYGSMNGWAADLISQEVADTVGKVWGLGSDTAKDPGPWEGEQRNMWKPTQVEALWFHGGNLHQSRHYSTFLALQLKARQVGLDDAGLRPPGGASPPLAGAGDDEQVLVARARREQPARLERGRAGGEQRAERAVPAPHDLGAQAGGAHPRERRGLAVDRGVRDQQDAAGPQVPRRGVDQAVEQDAPARAGLRVAARAAGGRRPAGKVGRVGHDDVEPAAGHRREQAPAAGLDADAVQAGAEPDAQQRAARHVDRGHRSGTAQRGGDRQRARPGTHVEHLAAGQLRPLAQRAGQQPRVTARPEHTWQPGDPHALRYPVSPTPPTASELRAAFDAPEPLTVGLEEELMLLDPATLDLLPRAAEVVDTAADPRVKLEMPAAQLELTLPPARSVPAAIAGLAAGRRFLAAAAAPVGRLAAAGVHPFAAPRGELNDTDRYRLTRGRVRRHRAHASSCARSRSTSRSAAPTGRSGSTTACARGSR